MNWKLGQLAVSVPGQEAGNEWGNGLNCVELTAFPLPNASPAPQSAPGATGADWDQQDLERVNGQSEIRINSWKEMQKVFTEWSWNFSFNACDCITMRKSNCMSSRGCRESGSILLRSERQLCCVFLPFIILSLACMHMEGIRADDNSLCWVMCSSFCLWKKQEECTPWSKWC